MLSTLNSKWGIVIDLLLNSLGFEWMVVNKGVQTKKSNGNNNHWLKFHNIKVGIFISIYITTEFFLLVQEKKQRNKWSLISFVWIILG